MDLPVEILELILLQTDTRNLLTAQRVCRLWRDVIQANRRLQEALFFRPSQPLAPGRKSVKNALVAERVWPYFLRTYLYPQNAHTKAMAHSDRRDHRRGDAAFLRPEASWRQMLLAQPPTNTFALVMCETRSSLSGHYLTDLSGVSLRMGDLEASIGAGRLVPTPQPWALWMNEGCAPVQSETLAIAYYRHWRTRRFERARRIGDCDVVYFEICTARYLQSYRECSRLGLSFETWLKLYVATEDEGWIL